MRTIIISLLIILQLNACVEKEEKTMYYSEITLTEQIDSSRCYITDTTIYNFILLALDKILNDSNTLHAEPVPVDISNCGFTFSDDSLTPYQLLSDKEKRFLIPYITGSKDDSIYIFNQLLKNKNKHWIAEKINMFPYKHYYSSMYLRPEDGEFDWDRFKKDGHGCQLSISIPLFNVIHTKAVITINSVCWPTAGSGQTFMLEKLKTGWTIIGTRSNWIS